MQIVFDHVGFIINKNTPLEKTILKDVSFEIYESGIYSFVGSSNSGKSAIADLINALIFPTSGKVYINDFVNDGRRIKNINKLRLETGYVFKNPYDMFFNKTVKKELEFGMKNFKYKTNKIDTRVNDALKLVGLDESYLDLDPNILTLVDAKKVALASVLIYNPSIIILDEPTNGISYSDQVELIKLLKLLKRKYNKTIIILSKNTNFCYEVSDKVYLLKLTRLAAMNTNKLLEDYEVLYNLGLEIPQCVKFINRLNKRGYKIKYTNNIKELVSEVKENVL